MNVFKRNPFRACAYTILILLLLTPFFAMQFSNEVNWSIFDFLIFACLLGSFALACEKFVSLSQKASYRVGAITLVFSFILLIWVNLAVGIVGDEGGALQMAVSDFEFNQT